MRTILTIAALVAVGAAHAHGGGLDSQGCDTNRKTGDYHCHRVQSQQTAPEAAYAAERRPTVQQTGAGPICHTGPRGGKYTITPSGRKNYAGC